MNKYRSKIKIDEIKNSIFDFPNMTIVELIDAAYSVGQTDMLYLLAQANKENKDFYIDCLTSTLESNRNDLSDEILELIRYYIADLSGEYINGELTS